VEIDIISLDAGVMTAKLATTGTTASRDTTGTTESQGTTGTTASRETASSFVQAFFLPGSPLMCSHSK
jgi:hypothetical protein